MNRRAIFAISIFSIFLGVFIGLGLSGISFMDKVNIIKGVVAFSAGFAVGQFVEEARE